MTQTMDPFEELASMFLTDADLTPPREAGGTTQTTIELLVVGHLPVRAGLWLTPYADAVARRAGTTVLVRLDGDEPMLQVLRGDEGRPPAEECRNLREAILSLGGSVRAWIVRPSARTATDELLAGQADRITILSSADQAAVVNAYRLVKDLVEAAQRRVAQLPSLGLAVIGAERDAADDVARRIDRTTGQCLEVSVPLLLCLPRIDAAARATCLRSFPGQTRPALDEVLAWIGEARSRVGAEGPPPRKEAVAVSEPMPPVQLQPQGSAASESPAALDETVEPGEPALSGLEAPSSLDDLIEGAAPKRTIKLAPKAATELEPKEPARSGEPDEEGRPVPLAKYVAALTPIIPRCPGHERVELAVDREGRIHLLGREETLREMSVVTAWARAHRHLLAMACPEHHFEPAGEIVCHCFTDEPVKVADLHGSDIRLHLLAPVEVEGRRGWYAAPLNGPGR
jgi:hypothetical protein